MSRYWFVCTKCAAPELFKEWSWVWETGVVRHCNPCGGLLRQCNSKESKELNARFPKKRKLRKSDGKICATYDDYLRSPEWRTIRARVLKRDNHKCRCGAKAQHVHHRSYDADVMMGLNDAKLIALCEPCHNRITFRQDHSKRGHRETERLLLLIEPGKPASP